MATLIMTDGTERQVKPAIGKCFTLEEMQGYVGGDIQMIPLPSGDQLVMDEEGKLKGKPTNRRATVMGAAAGTASDDVITGDVLVVPIKELEV